MTEPIWNILFLLAALTISHIITFMLGRLEASITFAKKRQALWAKYMKEWKASAEGDQYHRGFTDGYADCLSNIDNILREEPR